MHLLITCDDRAGKKKTKTDNKSGLAPTPRRRATSSASGRSSRMAVDTEDDNDSMVRPSGPALDDDPHEYVEAGKKKKKKHGKPAQVRCRNSFT
jgi:hypothetical protein